MLSTQSDEFGQTRTVAYPLPESRHRKCSSARTRHAPVQANPAPASGPGSPGLLPVGTTTVASSRVSFEVSRPWLIALIMMYLRFLRVSGVYQWFGPFYCRIVFPGMETSGLFPACFLVGIHLPWARECESLCAHVFYFFGEDKPGRRLLGTTVSTVRLHRNRLHAL